MKSLQKAFPHWARDDAGAITVDWVALTSATLLLGTAVVYAVFSEGVAPVTQKTSVVLASFNPAIDVGDRPFGAAESSIADSPSDTPIDSAVGAPEPQPLDWHDKYEGTGDWPH